MDNHYIFQLVILFISAALSISATAQQYRDFSCSVDQREVRFLQLRLPPLSGLQIRALKNSYARQGHCPGGYCGPKVLEVIQGVTSFSIQSATNGTLFKVAPNSGVPPHFVGVGMIWSLPLSTSTNQAMPLGGLISPLQPHRGGHIAVFDSSGLHERLIDLQNMPTSEVLVSELLRVFPTMSLALQLKSDLMEGRVDPRGGLMVQRGTRWAPHYTTCIRNGRHPSPAWTCEPTDITAICGAADGSVSLLIAPRARHYELAVGLRQGGPCPTQCSLLYFLDGGGSSQMVVRNHGSSSFDIRYGGPEEHLRPVDNYLIVGTPN